MPGIQEFCRFQTKQALILRALLVHASQVHDCQVVAKVLVLLLFLLLLLRLDVIPEEVQILQSPFPRQTSTSSLELRSFHVGSTTLQEVSCELICTLANHASSPPGVHPTKHLVPTSNH